MTFILASNNKNKLAEIRAMLAPHGIELISQSEAGLDINVEETGATFFENAALKARAACEASGKPCIADDSGLVVDALNGEPGVHSARYGGEGLTDMQRCELLLKNMEDKEQRDAKFVSCIVCAFPDGGTMRADGECQGVIAREPAGDGGFGYDPVFYIPNLGKTMAQLTMAEKNAISHRGKALRVFEDSFSNYLPNW